MTARQYDARLNSLRTIGRVEAAGNGLVAPLVLHLLSDCSAVSVARADVTSGLLTSLVLSALPTVTRAAAASAGACAPGMRLKHGLRALRRLEENIGVVFSGNGTVQRIGVGCGRRSE